MCEEYEIGGTYGYTYATKEGALVGPLDISRAWVDAGNTPETAYYGQMLAGGEASKINKGNPGDFYNQITNGSNSGVFQCDACRTLYGANFNNNICKSIWGSTRVVMIPQLNVGAKDTSSGETEHGCIIMNTVSANNSDNSLCITYQNGSNTCYDVNSNYCTSHSCTSQTDANYIGPFCHNSPTINGTPWSDEDNFPNNYLKGYLKSIVNDNVFSVANGNCQDTTTTIPSSTSPYCTMEKTGPVVKEMANTIATCALNNRDITNILDCPNDISQYFDKNECNDQWNSTACYAKQENCCRMAGLTKQSSLYFTNKNETYNWNKSNHNCYSAVGGNGEKCKN